MKMAAHQHIRLMGGWSLICLTGCSPTSGSVGAATESGAETSTGVATTADGTSSSPALDVPADTRDRCAEAEELQSSVGCEFYGVHNPAADAGDLISCTAVILSNGVDVPVHVDVSRDGESLPVEEFTVLLADVELHGVPLGSEGVVPHYEPYDPATGIPPRRAAALLLQSNALSCPDVGVQAAVRPLDEEAPNLYESGVHPAFRIRTDAPVSAYQVNPFAGGGSAATDATLLYPTHTWGTNYVTTGTTEPFAGSDDQNPGMSIVALESGTRVEFASPVAVVGGPGLPHPAAGETAAFELGAGEQAYFAQPADLRDVVVTADKPIAVFSSHECAFFPADYPWCEHMEEQLAPISTLGSSYVGVPHPARAIDPPREPAVWRLTGLVDGTELTWSSDVGGPQSLARGASVDVWTAEAFVVRSQDAAHPFLLTQFMLGSVYLQQHGYTPTTCAGDPEFVATTPAEQFLDEYTVYVDPTYQESDLILVRAPDESSDGEQGQTGGFRDVTLDCLGVVEDWTDVGEFQWAHVDLADSFVPRYEGCKGGVHTISSAGPFTVTVWGWGADPGYGAHSNWCVSHAYVGGTGTDTINDAHVPVG